MCTGREVETPCMVSNPCYHGNIQVTGSGKTLAFVIPVVEILLNRCAMGMRLPLPVSQWSGNEVALTCLPVVWE